MAHSSESLDRSPEIRRSPTSPVTPSGLAPAKPYSHVVNGLGYRHPVPVIFDPKPARTTETVPVHCIRRRPDGTVAFAPDEVSGAARAA